MISTWYQTTENRGPNSLLDFPIKSKGLDKWYGAGYYFWEKIEHAHIWGCKKVKTKTYDIYSQQINCSGFLDVIGNKEHRELFEKMYDKISQSLSNKIKSKFNSLNPKIELKDINRHIFCEMAFYQKEGFKGVVFLNQDNIMQTSVINRFNYKICLAAVVFENHEDAFVGLYTIFCKNQTKY